MAITLDKTTTLILPTRSTALWIRVLALIGVVLLLERTATLYLWSARAEHPFSAIGNFGTSTKASSPQTTLEKVSSSSTDPNGITKSIIVASVSKEHTGWINNNFPDWEINTYIVDDDTANYTVFKNAGRESTVYLTYIINHYWNLPEVMVFLHAKRYQWHNDDPLFDGIPPIRNLRLSHVANEGYVSLRCAQDPGCPGGVVLTPNKPDDFWSITHTYATTFAHFFPNDTMPERAAAPCCAQFAVSREAVLKRSPADYERMRQWLWSVEMDEGRSGRIFEYMWHYIFGKPANYCPPADECYCKTYGLCDLKCPAAPKSCLGRYVLPYWDKPFPKGWPRRGGGENGYPKDKWWEEFYPQSEYEGFTLREGAKTREEKYPDVYYDVDMVVDEIEVDEDGADTLADAGDEEPTELDVLQEADRKNSSSEDASSKTAQDASGDASGDASKNEN